MQRLTADILNHMYLQLFAQIGYTSTDTIIQNQISTKANKLHSHAHFTRRKAFKLFHGLHYHFLHKLYGSGAPLQSAPNQNSKLDRSHLGPAFPNESRRVTVLLNTSFSSVESVSTAKQPKTRTRQIGQLSREDPMNDVKAYVGCLVLKLPRRSNWNLSPRTAVASDGTA